MSLHLSSLPYNDWRHTKIALHLFAQIVGKIRMVCHPMLAHWWHVTYVLSSRGMTTGYIPYEDFGFELEFDFIDHQLIVATTKGDRVTMPLEDCTVQNFYQELMMHLEEFGIEVNITKTPFDPEKVGSNIRYDQDDQHVYDDLTMVNQFWQILCVIYPTFATFKGQFLGKSTPCHLFWHSFDYVLTFFSGRPGPDVSGMDRVAKAAYSHEVISFGFWPGDDSFPEPAFYGYAYPELPSVLEQSLLPEKASWIKQPNGHLGIYRYEDWLAAGASSDALRDFLFSVYQAGAKSLDWPEDFLSET